MQTLSYQQKEIKKQASGVQRLLEHGRKIESNAPKMLNWKTWQLRMHCNLRSPDATPVLFLFNYDVVISLKSLPYHSVFAAGTLRYAVTSTFNL